MIAVDAGSTDPGPYYLGSGASFTDRSAVRRDLALILTAARERGIPVLIGSAGGAGAAPHLAWAEGIVREIAAAHRLRFRLATIAADVETNLTDTIGIVKTLSDANPSNQQLKDLVTALEAQDRKEQVA